MAIKVGVIERNELIDSIISQPYSHVQKALHIIHMYMVKWLYYLLRKKPNIGICL